jgi:hypothetical protein
MLLFPSTTDKLQLVTGAAATVDVHASWVDISGSTVTHGKTNTAISTATTTDIVAAPAASTTRNIQSLFIRNKDAALSVDVTVVYNQNGTSFELYKTTLAPGNTLEFIEGVGFFVLTAAPTAGSINSSTADQAIGASVTAYLTGSALRLPSTLKAGTVLQWTVMLAKTAAAIAVETITVRFGINQSTSDTARNTFTGDTETAIADEAMDYIQATIRGPIGASCVVEATWVRDNNLTTTGFSNTARKAQVRQATSAAFDITPAGTFAGICIATGASHALTIRQVVAEMVVPN